MSDRGLDTNELARMRGCSVSKLHKLMNADSRRPKNRGKGFGYSLEEAGAWLMTQGRRDIVTDDDGNHYDYTVERARLAAEQADGQSLKNSILRRESAPTDALTWTIARLGEQIGAALSTLPGQLKRQLPTLQQAEIDIARREVAAVMNMAANAKIDLDDYDSLRRPETEH